MVDEKTGIGKDADGNEYLPHGSRLRFEGGFAPPNCFAPSGFREIRDHEDLSQGFGRKIAVDDDFDIIAVLKDALLENAKFRIEVRSLRGEVSSLTGIIRDEIRNAMASARDEADDSGLPSSQSCV